MSIKPLKAVFWDLDGTLADTEMNGHRVAFNKAFKDFGLSWHWDETSYQKLLKIAGGFVRMRYYSDSIGTDISDEILQQIHSKKKEYYLTLVNSSQIKWRPGVFRILAELQNNNIYQWIVTASGINSVNSLVFSNFNELNSPFSGFITSNDIQKGKPDPECYLKALQLSNVNKENSLAIEDSISGLLSATSAGLKCLVTPSSWEEPNNVFNKKAVAVLDHLGEVGYKCKVINGPPCHKGMVTIEYLTKIINSTI